MKNYRSNEVVQLSEISHVLKKSGMYIGDTSASIYRRWLLDAGKINQHDIEYSPGLFKLFDEIISNSIDEALRTNFDFANKIDVSITNNIIKILDNGRGIPVVASEETEITQAELAFTSLRAGGNFGEEEVVSIGTHGLGSTLVNIMSDKFIAETCDGKNKIVVDCSNNMNDVTRVITKSTKNYTSVEYTPDFKQFDGVEQIDDNHISLINKRLHDLSICFPKIRFTFNSVAVRQGSPKKAFTRYCQMYSDNVAVAECSDYSVAVFPVEQPTNISFVNGIDTVQGGTHVDVVSQIVTDELLAMFTKKYKKLDIKAADIKNHLGFIIFTNSIKNCKFNSQTKERITNKVSDIKPIFKTLSNKVLFFRDILENPELIDPIVETKRLKLEAKERAALKKAQKGAKRLKVPAHVPATGKNIEDRILFLSEGQSASGQLICVRDPLIHGSFPLKGKVLNTNGKKPSEIMANAELSAVMSIVGLTLGQKAENLNYGKIVIMTDADYDGNAIAALLINFFHRWPELFIEKRIVLLKTPIVLARKGKQVKRYYNLEEYEADVKLLKTWEVSYIKGLGSLQESEYKRIIDKPKYVTIKLDIKSTENLEMAFGKDVNKRKAWLRT